MTTTPTIWLHAARPNGSHAWMLLSVSDRVLTEFVALAPADTEWSLTDNTVHHEPPWGGPEEETHDHD